MAFFYIFIIALIFFVIWVAARNRTLEKDNREFLKNNTVLRGSEYRYKDWIKRLAKMEPFEAYSEIQKADLNEQDVE